MTKLIGFAIFLAVAFDCANAYSLDDCFLQTIPQFKCHDKMAPKNHASGPGGHCLPLEYQCDCKSDCHDGSDEWGCELSMITRHQCVGVDGCYDVDEQCNCWYDCPNGSDERDCYNNCPTCDNGEMVFDKKHTCDCVKDCKDGKDEEQCMDDTLYAKRFICADGGCVTIDGRCNMTSECADGSDEADCGDSIKCYSCEARSYRGKVSDIDCLLANTDGMKEIDCQGYCTTVRKTESVFRHDFRTVIRRGCERLKAVDPSNIGDNCYNMKKPDHVFRLLPGVSTYPGTRRMHAYDVQTCTSDLCNTNKDFGTEFCADEKPDGPGLLVAFDKAQSGAIDMLPCTYMFVLISALLSVAIY